LVGFGVRGLLKKSRKESAISFGAVRETPLGFLIAGAKYTVVSLAFHGSHKVPYVTIAGLGVKMID
jgi:hypothetical protein